MQAFDDRFQAGSLHKGQSQLHDPTALPKRNDTSPTTRQEDKCSAVTLRALRKKENLLTPRETKQDSLPFGP
jgi:hypothetical protein